MIKIAIVEDEKLHSQQLKEYLYKFASERNTSFDISVFANAVTFIEKYSCMWDIVFMDIRMPHMSGMEAAHFLRKLDKTVILIFISSLSQYAIEGYEVNALNYILKPLSYPDFALKFSRAYDMLQSNEKCAVILPTEHGIVKLAPNEIAYCEVIKHQTVFHTLRGNFSHYATLRSVQEKLTGYGFCKCNHCYLVNLGFVKGINNDDVIVSYGNKTEKLSISRNKKKPFTEAFRSYLNCNFMEDV